MEEGSEGYADWYTKKRRAYHTLYQRQRRARLRAENAATVAADETIAQEQGSNVGKIQDLTSYNRQFQKATASHSRNIALYTVQELSGLTVEAQQASIEKLLAHPLVRNIIPSYLSDVSIVKHQNEVIGNIKSGITTHCAGARKSEFLVAKNIVCTFALGQSVGSSTAVAKVLGVDRRIIKKGIERRIQLDLQLDAFWINNKRTRVRSISMVMRETIVEWWTTESTVSPNRKDIARKRVGVRTYEEHPTHYLQVSQVSL